jgi:YD repeat-containing protein
MRKDLIAMAFILAIAIVLPAISLFNCAALAQESIEPSTGTYLIFGICQDNGIDATIEEIEQLAGSSKGRTSLWGLKTAAEEKGLIATGLKTGLEHLNELAETGYIIAILTENRTYVRVNGVSRDFVNVHNPSIYPKSSSIPKEIFEKQWDGKLLLIQTGSVEDKQAVSEMSASADTMSLDAMSFDGGITGLSGMEMQAAAGGSFCANCSGGAGPPPGWNDPSNNAPNTTADPVVLSNSNLYSTETDFAIATKGLIPFEITRTYNAQVVSSLEDWQPLRAAGPWAVREGVYNGYGDRSITNRIWKNVTITADIKTIVSSADENYWETAALNLRYQDMDNRYYFFIGRDGTLELGKIQDEDEIIMMQKTSAYDPLVWNTVKIIVNNNNTKVYVNDNLEIDYTDDTPLDYAGHVGLESRFCYAQFDNVNIESGDGDGQTYFYDFNTSDRIEPFGKNWSYTYGIHIQEFQNGDVRVVRGNDRSDLFQNNGDGTYAPPVWLYETLTKDAAGYTLRQKNGSIYRFDSTGRLEYIEDRFANRITLSYEDIYGEFRLKYVTGPASRQFTFEYWPDGKIKEIKDPTGINKYQYFYNNDQLIQVIDPRGNSKHYEYDPLTDLRTAYINREGHRYEYTYTYNARIQTQKDPEENITTFECWWDATHVVNNDGETWFYWYFTDSSMLDDITDKLGAITHYEWDENSNLTAIEEPYGKRTEFQEYDANGNAKKIIDPENGPDHPTEFQYDPEYSLITYKKDQKGNETTYIYESGMLKEIHEPLGKTTAMTHYPYGKVKTRTDAENNLTEYEYDPRGYLKKIKRYTDTGFVEKNFTYDMIGNLLSETDEEGNVKNYTYDENNNLKEVKDDANNILASYTYDKNDDIKTMTDALGHTVYYEYDWTGHVIKITEYDEYGEEYSIEYTYDNKDYLHLAKSDLISVKDQEGNVITYEYTKYTYTDDQDPDWSETRKIVLETDAEGRTSKTEYSQLGNISYVQDAAGKETFYKFDYNGRVKEIDYPRGYPEGAPEAYTYDKVGNLITKRDQKWQSIMFEYDVFNRLKKKIYPDSLEINYDYNLVGNLTSVTSSNGATVMTYDKLNRLENVTYPENKVVSYEYYNNGLRKKLTYPDSSYITYHYDSLLRLTDIKDEAGSVIAHYEYNGLSGRRDSVTYMNDASIEYEYDKLSRLTSIKNKLSSGEVFSSFDYTYDKAGNRKSVNSNEGSLYYTYDRTYQLKDVIHPDLRTSHYEYDSMGNRIYADDKGEHTDYTLSPSLSGEGEFLDRYASISQTSKNIDVEGTVTGDEPSVTVSGVEAIISGGAFLAEDVML